MFNSFDLEKLTDIYLIPWGISITFALVIFVVGRILARIVVSIALIETGSTVCDDRYVRITV